MWVYKKYNDLCFAWFSLQTQRCSFKIQKEQIMRKWHFFLCDISIFSSYNNKSIILQQRRYLYSQIASRTREQRKREIYTRDLRPYSCNNQIINIQRGIHSERLFFCSLKFHQQRQHFFAQKNRQLFVTRVCTLCTTSLSLFFKFFSSFCTHAVRIEK